MYSTSKFFNDILLFNLGLHIELKVLFAIRKVVDLVYELMLIEGLVTTVTTKILLFSLWHRSPCDHSYKIICLLDTCTDIDNWIITDN